MSAASDYMNRLFAPTDARHVAFGDPLDAGEALDHDTLHALAGTARLPAGTSASAAEEDLALRARLHAFCLDVGLTCAQSMAVLAGYGDPIDMAAFRDLLASVAVVNAPRALAESRRRAAVSEAALAIAVASGVPEMPQRGCRAAVGAS